MTMTSVAPLEECCCGILNNRLYFSSLKKLDLIPRYNASENSVYCFSIDNELVYEPFCADFGPFNMSCFFRFCQKLDGILQNEKLKDKKIYFCCGFSPQKKSNAAVLIGGFCVLYLNIRADEIYNIISALKPFLDFRDPTAGFSTYPLSVYDCIKAVGHAKEISWLRKNSFHIEMYEKLEDFDITWIVPSKILAFSAPSPLHRSNNNGNTFLIAEDYAEFFVKTGVKGVIRLSKNSYDKKKFTKYGLLFYDLYFSDGSCPSDSILKAFFEILESNEGPFAIHCKAGLGRTGVLIGCYLMKHFRFTANEALGWIRMMRPGSVIGFQQNFLKKNQSRMWKYGDEYREKQRKKSLQQRSTPQDANLFKVYKNNSKPLHVGQDVPPPQNDPPSRTINADPFLMDQCYILPKKNHPLMTSIPSPALDKKEMNKRILADFAKKFEHPEIPTKIPRSKSHASTPSPINVNGNRNGETYDENVSCNTNSNKTSSKRPTFTSYSAPTSPVISSKKHSKKMNLYVESDSEAAIAHLMLEKSPDVKHKNKLYYLSKPASFSELPTFKHVSTMKFFSSPTNPKYSKERNDSSPRVFSPKFSVSKMLLPEKEPQKKPDSRAKGARNKLLSSSAPLDSLSVLSSHLSTMNPHPNLTPLGERDSSKNRSSSGELHGPLLPPLIPRTNSDVTPKTQKQEESEWTGHPPSDLSIPSSIPAVGSPNPLPTAFPSLPSRSSPFLSKSSNLVPYNLGVNPTNDPKATSIPPSAMIFSSPGIHHLPPLPSSKKERVSQAVTDERNHHVDNSPRKSPMDDRPKSSPLFYHSPFSPLSTANNSATPASSLQNHGSVHHPNSEVLSALMELEKKPMAANHTEIQALEEDRKKGKEERTGTDLASHQNNKSSESSDLEFIELVFDHISKESKDMDSMRSSNDNLLEIISSLELNRECEHTREGKPEALTRQHEEGTETQELRRKGMLEEEDKDHLFSLKFSGEISMSSEILEEKVKRRIGNMAPLNPSARTETSAPNAQVNPSRILEDVGNVKFAGNSEMEEKKDEGEEELGRILESLRKGRVTQRDEELLPAKEKIRSKNIFVRMMNSIGQPRKLFVKNDIKKDGTRKSRMKKGDAVVQKDNEMLE